MEDMPQQLIVRRWTRHPKSVGLARTELQRALCGWGLAVIEEPALLILSELVTNAVVHARVPKGRQIETRFECEDKGVRIEVHDASDEKPTLCPQTADSERGRGLTLVEAMADEWAVSKRNGPGKVVWAVLRLPR
ncbi:ATP-binding protein [Streptomyces sp. NBC_01481]|uniref:ATP-binding protein n=1 Tax=Streptomyces sp. NBC_01481 TaxID=2975869 RepID=UPI002254D8B4|nr:ATP-binding protein [Streptomyces sp. NBC_01481]MCX4582134.1 ATP-binding protein [Streptomyces sp. NBC_01481]